MRFKAVYMSQISIPRVEDHSVPRMNALVAALSFLHADDSGFGRQTNSRDPLMRDYYDEILNALVYELYLPDDMHMAGLNFFNLVTAANLPKVQRQPRDPATQLAALRLKFEEIYAPSHPLRAALQKLHTLDPIRIIEGKA